MLELFVDSDSVSIENVDDLLEAFPKHGQRAVESAMKSEGHRLRNIMKQILSSDSGVGYVDWPRLNPHTGVLNQAKNSWVQMYKKVWEGEKGSKKRVSRHVGTKLSKKQHPLLRFKGGLRYSFDSGSGTLSVGFVNPSSKFFALIKKQSKGYSTPVTDKMRKRMFALGFPLKKETTELVTPARPLIDPVFAAEEETIMKNIEAKFWSNLSRYMGE
ncbi:MAG: hypothetical protein AB7E04_14150 [Desulfobacteraceae bacterium]